MPDVRRPSDNRNVANAFHEYAPARDVALAQGERQTLPQTAGRPRLGRRLLDEPHQVRTLVSRHTEIGAEFAENARRSRTQQAMNALVGDRLIQHLPGQPRPDGDVPELVRRPQRAAGIAV